MYIERTALKEHKCSRCGDIIKKKDKYILSHKRRQQFDPDPFFRGASFIKKKLCRSCYEKETGGGPAVRIRYTKGMKPYIELQTKTKQKKD